MKIQCLKKEILFIKNDLNKISVDPNRYKLVINAYKKKLVELGAIKEVKDKYATKEGKLFKKKAESKQKNTTKKKTEDKVKSQAKSQNSTKNESEKSITEPKRRGRPRKNV